MDTPLRSLASANALASRAHHCRAQEGRGGRPPYGRPPRSSNLTSSWRSLSYFSVSTRMNGAGKGKLESPLTSVLPSKTIVAFAVAATAGTASNARAASRATTYRYGREGRWADRLGGNRRPRMGDSFLMVRAVGHSQPADSLTRRASERFTIAHGGRDSRTIARAA